jgi:RNA recognition motif-containing protein
MGTENDSKKAISGLNGTLFMGKTLTVTEAISRQPRAAFHEKKGLLGKDRSFKKAW